MRSIKENLLNRLSAQAEEAEIQGLTKISAALTSQIEKNASIIRKDSAKYSYTDEQFRQDIEEKLWDTIIRTADFFDKNINDVAVMQEVVERYADKMIHELQTKLGVQHGVGKYEENLPGEINVKE